MNATLTETVFPPADGHGSMKFTFPPESRPLEGYTIKRAIHRGGFGEVYYALSDGGKEVALKLLQQNLEVELRGVTQCLNLKHPHLVTIFDIRTDADGDHWVVMEYMHGRSLDRLLADHNGPLSLAEAEKWLAGIVEGLSFLHDRGIVHRDLKPANIFLENGVVKIGDVGLSKFITHSKRSAQTESVGTVYYMAPEVSRGRYGHEVDIYSLGVLLYEMLTGRLPFNGESTAEILMKHLTEKPDLSPLPRRLRPVLANALEKDPLKRTADARQLLAEFRQAVAGIEIPRTLSEDSFAAATGGSRSDAPGNRAEGPSPPWRDTPVSWGEMPDKKWQKYVARMERKAARHARREERKAVRHAFRMERKAAKHARKTGPPAQNLPHPPHRPQEDNRGRSMPASVAVAAPSAGKSGPSANGLPERKNHNGRDEQTPPWLPIVALVVLVLAVTMPHTFVSLVHVLLRVVLVGGILVLLWWGSRRVRHWFSSWKPLSSAAGSARVVPVVDLEQPTKRPPLRPDVASSYRPPNAGRPARPSYAHPSQLEPETPRHIPARTRLIEWCSSLSFAVFATALVTAGVAFLSPVLHSPSQILFFAVSSLLGSWGILSAAKWYEGTRTPSGHRRLVTMLAGLAVGLTTFALYDFLPVSLVPAETNGGASFFAEISAGPEIEEAAFLPPGPVTFLLFFGGLFLLRRWWRHADSLRRSRVSVSSVLLTTLTAMLWALFLGFPVLWGVTWAAAVSSVVHLAAVWIPPADRRQLLEGQHG